MPKADNNPDELYVRLAAFFLGDAAITQSAKFGKGIRYRDKVFAMLVKGELVVKLPEDSVVSLIQKKTGRAFMHGKKAMKEWLVVESTDFGQGKKLATRALKAAKN